MGVISPMLARPPASRTSAFTLIELLAVVAIMAILSGIAIGTIQGMQSRAAAGRAKAELAVIATALEEFKRTYGDYPQLGDFNQAPLAPTNTAAGPGTATVQARLFNCLTGVYGPTRFATDDRLAGPMLLDASRLSL